MFPQFCSQEQSLCIPSVCAYRCPLPAICRRRRRVVKRNSDAAFLLLRYWRTTTLPIDQLLTSLSHIKPNYSSEDCSTKFINHRSSLKIYWISEKSTFKRFFIKLILQLNEQVYCVDPTCKKLAMSVSHSVLPSCQLLWFTHIFANSGRSKVFNLKFVKGNTIYSIFQ